jgi:NAD(P)H-dependent FMN reductase
VDELPESRARAAEELLQALKAGASIDPVDLALLLAPEDDEPETPEEAAAVREAREQVG